jgi:HD-GYP domain-containing protein (c-di-GMP phosphodiesterase class II)
MPGGTAAVPLLSLKSSELADLAGDVLNRHFGVPFLFYYPGSPPSISGATRVDQLPLGAILTPLAQQCLAEAQVLVQPISNRLQALTIPLKCAHRRDLVAIGIFASFPEADPGDDSLSRLMGDVEYPNDVPYCQPELLRKLGQAALTAILEHRQLCVRETELKQLAGQLTRNYEEITLLHQLTREAQISQGAESLQQMTLSLLAEMLPERQVAYVSSKESDAVLSQGEQLLKPRQCRMLIHALGTNAGRNVLVDNRLSERGLAPEFAAAARLVSVPVVEGKQQFGWLMALGRAVDVDLGSVEASLMGAVAAILATHQTNVKLYRNIKDLFLGIVRALTSAIDAKDPYTCGHSERVARLAYQIARRMGLPEDQQNKVYLSGLLHDVGKIGIRDSVLLKTGRLTDEEMTHMKLHPRIGFDILSAVRQLQPVLSGVRSHHENVDGTGYPDGLRGSGISLMARIVAAADSYDAMSSDRPYRRALALREIVENFRKGSGKQWDATVLDVLFDILLESESKKSAKPKPGPEGIPRAIDTSSSHVFDAMDLSYFNPSSFDRV